MALDADDKILQDFLVEAGEILERLGEELVSLEQRPDDYDLLNSVFRGFHTIKGGAGFLNLKSLVDVCHRAEDVFNLLRQGARKVDAELMDAVLQVLDVVNAMFQRLRAAEEPEAADVALLRTLEQLARPDAAPAQAAAPAPAASAADGDMTDAEFEALLDQRAGAAKPTAPPQAARSPDEITDAEFDALLDALHGSPKRAEAKPTAAAPPPPPPPPQQVEVAAVKTVTGEVINRDRAPPKVEAGAAETTVRVDTKRLDDIMNMVGELVLVRNRLVTLESLRSDEEMAKAVANIDVVTANLQVAVMKTRMQPIKKVFGRFPRVVRDLARHLSKEVNLELRGEETDLDKNLVEALADPLVHLVRNSIDHGIELPAKREAAGKPRLGTVLLAAEQEGDHIRLTIADDGAGMDPEVLRRKAVEKGLMSTDAAARLTPQDCFELIFMPGFSTKSEISDVSGRGVGMDVVKTSISRLNGTVEIQSERGRGTQISIKLPLTLAILPTLMVVVGGQIFALPLSNVSEIFNLTNTRTNVVDGQTVVMMRDKPLPLYHLRHWLVKPEHLKEKAEGEPDHVVVVHIGTQRAGFVVDQLIGQEEVVIKPLGALLHGTPGLAGATITGDGRMALILDLAGMLRRYVRHARPRTREVA